MQKFSATDIKPFSFDEIKADKSVGGSKFEQFSFKDLEGKVINERRPSEETIRAERNYALKNEFRIDDTVKKMRGIEGQEKSDIEHRIEDEVQRRLKQAFDDAYKEGLEKGKAEGRAITMKGLDAVVQERINEVESVIADVHTQCSDLVVRNEKNIQEFVKRFTKWIIMREIDNKTYLTDLLGKLILELNDRRNLIIKVGRDNFSQMPEVVAAVESKLGTLSNVRIEIVPELNHPGIILESENGLIDGSLEGVFGNIDKIFEQVLNNES